MSMHFHLLISVYYGKSLFSLSFRMLVKVGKSRILVGGSCHLGDSSKMQIINSFTP